MHILTPRFILEESKRGNRSGRFDAVVLFVDTSGFTPLTIELNEKGRDGAEVLADILYAVFEPLVEAVYSHGGYIAGFAGDAFKAIFPIANGQADDCEGMAFEGPASEAHLRALAAAEQILRHMRVHPIHETRYGKFEFIVRVSMAAGAVTWSIWSSDLGEEEQSRGYSFSGPAIEVAIEGEDHVAGGELVVTQSVYNALTAAGPELAVGHALVGEGARYIVITKFGTPPNTAESTIDGVSTEMQGASPEARRFYADALLTTTLRGEFRPVYNLFVNVQYLPDPGSEDDFLPRFFQLLHQYGGYLCRIGQIGASDPGGTFLLFWGAPSSHENDLVRVLSFVLALREQVSIPLRAGVTHAIVYAGFVGSQHREEYTCHGSSVNQAARQMTTASWGEILLDAETARRAQDEFDVSLAGHFLLKGLTDEQPLFRLTERRLQSDGDFYQLDFIGRNRELEELQTAVQPIFSGDFGGITLINGEAGIGKSRLVHEFLMMMEFQSDVRILVGQTDEILREAFNPFRYLLSRYFEQSPQVDEDTNKERFTTIWDELIAEIEDEQLRAELTRTRSFLGALLHLYWPDSFYAQLEPELRHENTLAALRALIQAESRQKPLILLLEDGQWLDAESHTLLQRIARGGQPFPLAILITARPPDAGTDPALASELIQHELSVEALSALDVAALANDYLGSPASDELVALLTQRAEGNPFFVEQMLLYLQERGLLTDDGAGGQIDESAIGGIIELERALPTDLQTMLVARLDRLSQEVKNVVQTAAVLGREFSVQILSQMLQGDQALTSKVALAQDAAVWNALTELRYLFRHALLHDAAYEMQLRARLATLHSLAADSIEQLYHEDIAPYYADLVHHYREAEQPLHERRYAELAGNEAAEQFANDEAIRYFSRALALTPNEAHDERYPLLLARERLYTVAGKSELRLSDISELALIVERANDDGLRAEVAMVKAAYSESRAQYAECIIATQQAITLAPNDPQLQAKAFLQWGEALLNQSEFDDAHQKLSRGLTIARTSDLQWEEASILHALGMAWHYQSNYPLAHQHFEEALAIFRQINALIETGRSLNSLGIVANRLDDYSNSAYFEEAMLIWQKAGYIKGQGLICMGRGNVALAAGDYEEAQSRYEQGLQIALEIGDRLGESNMYYNLAIVAQRTGLLEQALAQFAAARESYHKIGHQQGVTSALAGMGNIYVNLGQWEAAYEHLKEGLDGTRSLNIRSLEADLWTSFGFVLNQLDRLAEATDAYARSLAIRRELKQTSLALVPLASMAWVATKQGNNARAQTLIDEVLSSLPANPVDRIYDPIRFYLNCLHTLKALDDPRAQEILEKAHDLLQERANKLADPDARRAYLEEIPDHHEIVRMFGQLSTG